MTKYSRDGRYARAGARAVAEWLKVKTEAVSLFKLTVVADNAMRAKGMRGDYGDSIWDYSHMVPDGWSCRWMTGDAGCTQLVMCVPDGYAGSLRQTQCPDS